MIRLGKTGCISPVFFTENHYIMGYSQRADSSLLYRSSSEMGCKAVMLRGNYISLPKAEISSKENI